MTSLLRYCLSIILDFWERSRLGKAMSVLVPSLLQFVQPTSPNQRARARDNVADRRCDKSMDDFAAEIRTAFEAPVQTAGLLDYSRQLQGEYLAKLQSSPLSMLPSYQHTLPTGKEEGDFLALDVGGSTFRAALIRLAGAGKANGGEGLQVRRIRSFPIDERIRQLVGRDFFDWIASKIGEMLQQYNHINGTTNARLQMGLTWSFPIELTSPRSGKLLKMGKGFAAGQGVEGENLGDLVVDACRARGLNVELCAIINDGEATLLAQAYRDQATRMSLILGTGMNAAAFLPMSALDRRKFGQREDGWYAIAERVVVNTELSMFGKTVFPTTKWDELLNENHRVPDYQPLEYLVTGRYLGEILRLILLEAIATAGLFDGEIPHRLDEPYAFETRVLAVFESDHTPKLTAARSAFLAAHPMRSPPRQNELEFIRNVGKLASERAAAYLATALHALWAVRTKAEGIEPGEASHVTIACDGSMVEKYPNFRARTQGYLDQLCVLSGASEGAVTLDMTPESSIFGAAVAVSCMAGGGS